jgi:acyl carrier protein
MAEDRQRVLEAICQNCEQMFGEPALTGEENFFELGGTSLDAVELITILKESHGLDIEYQDVFESRSLADLADRVLKDCKSGT